MAACYPAGTTVYINSQAWVSASWPGNFKVWDWWIIASDNLANLAAAEAAVDAGGSVYLAHGTYLGVSDSTGGGDFALNMTNTAMSPLTTTSRYVSLYFKPQFNSVNWYTNENSTITLGSSGVGGASSTACPVYPPVADFSVDHTSPEVGEAIVFTDLSTNTPTSWAWTFGDGGTSTSQNPTHTYAVPGIYDVTLTATNSNGSDSETKTAYIYVLAAGTPDPPTPAGVLLEIYASAPGSARWDVAKWDEATWGEAGWRDVTPYGVNVDITWGSTSPDDGILTVPSAASWAVDYYDPDRILDPSNEDGPYFGDLIPGLPIRVSHRSLVIRVGNVTGISHSYIKPQSGFMRAADNITVLANADVPSDTTLSDTLYARAQDAIEAAGLAVQVRPVVGTDPAVSPWVTGTREWSVWEWIRDAAQETLQIPFIDKDGFVGFRPWALPLARGRGVSSPELIGLQVISDYSGLYSVVQATDATDTVIERALTPPPRYGARVFARTEHTLNAGDWADAVLADRAFPILRWQPGDIYPLTALSVEQHATIEAVERISISFPEADPAIFVSGIVVGGEIQIRGKQGQAAKWRFTFYTAQTINEPLIETGGAPTDYLLRTGGGEYLYPSS